MSLSKKLLVFVLVLFGTVSMLAFKVNAGTVSLMFRHGDFSNDVITTHVYLNTGGSEIRSVTADFNYPSDILEVTGVSTDNSMFSEFIRRDYSVPGTIYISCYSLEGVSGEGNVITVTFKAKEAGDAKLEFTDDVAALDSATSQDVLEQALPGYYSVRGDLSVLPQTGVTTGSQALDAVILLIWLIMLIVLIIAGFSMWGGIYISLGKWKVEGKYEVGIGKGSKKNPKTTRKARKAKSTPKEKKK